MKKLIEWFFSLFISDDRIKEVKDNAITDLKKANLDYKNKAYFNRLKSKKRYQKA